MKLWGGRFEQGPSEVFERYSNSLAFDRRLIDADILGSQVFAKALEHEKKVSAAINRLYEMAAADKDYASLPLLQWFITEQVEEEANVGRVLERVRLGGGHPSALLVLDRELGARKGD